MATFWCESDLMVAARLFPILWRCGLHDYKIGFITSAVYPLWQINGILVWLCKTKKVLGCGNQFFCFAVDPPFNLISVTCAHIFKIKPLWEEIFSSNSSCACVSKKRTAVRFVNRKLRKFLSARMGWSCVHNFIWKRKECMHAITLGLIVHHLLITLSVNGLWDFSLQEGTWIFHPPPCPLFLGYLKSPSLDLCTVATVHLHIYSGKRCGSYHMQ